MVNYIRNLPHFHPEGGIFFITFRLAGSIPIKTLIEIKAEFKKEQKILVRSNYKFKKFQERLYSLQKKYFGKFDKSLDTNQESPHWLKHDSIAEVVAQKIFEFNLLKYELIVFCIMHNHVHLVIMPNEDLIVSVTNIKGKTVNYIVADTMRLIKGSTAREANLILNRKGSFWHHESYDHVVRNEKELCNIIKYVLNNPVKTGFVNNWRDWKWSYSLYDL